MSKRITISHLLRFRRDWFDASVASILLGLGVLGSPLAFGQCRPPSPAPCAADGMCYPARNTWGNYITHWRPYPGDTIGLAPTPADAGATEIQDELPTFIVPPPDQEDLRGPVRPTRPTAPAAGPGEMGGPAGELPAGEEALEQSPPANGERPAEGPAVEEAPGPLEDLDLPGFGPPQGLLQPLPQIEDGPPALPNALSQAIVAGNEAQLHGASASRPLAAAAPTADANVNAARPVRPETVAQSRFVTPTSGDIELTNPAAKNVQKTMDQDLKQAIYYEAPDVDTAIK